MNHTHCSMHLKYKPTPLDTPMKPHPILTQRSIKHTHCTLFSRIKSRHHRYSTIAKAYGDSTDSSGDSSSLPKLPERPSGPFLSPSYWLSPEESIQAQLHALQCNNIPYPDHGIEVLYRFAGFDPWQRSRYFGRSLDLGQFERFRRIMYTKCFVTLVGHSESSIESALEVSEDIWMARVLVNNKYRKESAVYNFTMTRRIGGRYDGSWYCTELTCDGCDDKHVYGVI